MKRVAIIDYGMGNLFSVKQACERSGIDSFVTSSCGELAGAYAVILPGVGAFGDAIKNLDSLGLADEIKAFIARGRPFFGICLGMQLLLSYSEEFGRHDGLGLIKGKVVRFSDRLSGKTQVKVPQVGWNGISMPAGKKPRNWKSSPLMDVPDGEYMYFVHSYYAEPADEDCVLSVTEYEGTRYCSSLKKDNIFACQFHPEKSAEHGLKIYRDWYSAMKGQ